MPTTKVVFKITPLSLQVDALLPSILEKAESSIYRLGRNREDREACQQTIRDAALQQATYALSWYSNDTQVTAESTEVNISVQTDTPIGTAELTTFEDELLITDALLVSSISKTDTYTVENIKDWKKETRGMWTHWNHGSLILTQEKPLRGKKMVWSAENLDGFIKYIVTTTIESSIKYSLASYRDASTR